MDDDAFSYGLGVYISNASYEKSKQFVDKVQETTNRTNSIVLSAVSCYFDIGAIVNGGSVLAGVVSMFTVPFSAYEISANVGAIIDEKSSKHTPETFSGLVAKSLGGNEHDIKNANFYQTLISGGYDIYKSKNNPAIVTTNSLNMFISLYTNALVDDTNKNNKPDEQETTNRNSSK